jgi:hypothetical protein
MLQVPKFKSGLEILRRFSNARPLGQRHALAKLMTDPQPKPGTSFAARHALPHGGQG